MKGDIFEYLLQYLSRQPQSDMGQFRTPRQIRMAMVEMLDPDLGDTIFDPACGTAGFLIDALEHILAKYSAEPREVPIYGEEWLETRGRRWRRPKSEIPNLQTYRKGRGRKDSRLGTAGTLHLRHRGVAADDAHFDDEPGAARHPQRPCEAGQRALRTWRHER